MKFGFVFPRADVFSAIEFARAAEEADWDAFFLWEPTYGIDAWVTLAAIAMETRRIRLGTLLSPPSRMRPWKLASEVLTLYILSKGRSILCVGLGAIDTGFEEFGEEIDRKIRAELLDESLDIMTGLWKWDLSSYTGKHYKISNLKECEFFNRHPPPEVTYLHEIPIWVVGAWPFDKSMKRALRHEGIIPTLKNKDIEFEAISPRHVQEIKKYVLENRIEKTLFDIIVEGKTPSNSSEAKMIVKPFADAGATWWIESDWTNPNLDELLDRVKAGPPR